jgi:hypothetical protein
MEPSLRRIRNRLDFHTEHFCESLENFSSTLADIWLEGFYSAVVYHDDPPKNPYALHAKDKAYRDAWQQGELAGHSLCRCLQISIDPNNSPNTPRGVSN